MGLTAALASPGGTGPQVTAERRSLTKVTQGGKEKEQSESKREVAELSKSNIYVAGVDSQTLEG